MMESIPGIPRAMSNAERCLSTTAQHEIFLRNFPGSLVRDVVAHLCVLAGRPESVVKPSRITVPKALVLMPARI